MSEFVAYVVAFVLLAGLAVVADLINPKLSQRVEEMGAVRWVGGATAVGSTSIVIGIAMSTPYHGLLVAVIGLGCWVYGTLRSDSARRGEDSEGQR